MNRVYELAVYDIGGVLWERRMLVESDNSDWVAVRAKVLAVYPEYAGRRMDAHRLSPELLAAAGYENLEWIKGA